MTFFFNKIEQPFPITINLFTICVIIFKDVSSLFNRFIKSQYAGKRAAPGSHSSRAHIETRHSDKSESGVKSSALSDTSEAPSLGK